MSNSLCPPESQPQQSPIAEILVFAAVQPAFASMATSSRFNILTGTRTLDHFQQATRDFRSFFLFAMVWLIITSLVLAKKYDWKTGLLNVGVQGIMVWWITRSLWENLHYVARELGFEQPRFFGRVE